MNGQPDKQSHGLGVPVRREAWQKMTAFWVDPELRSPVSQKELGQNVLPFLSLHVSEHQTLPRGGEETSQKGRPPDIPITKRACFCFTTPVTSRYNIPVTFTDMIGQSGRRVATIFPSAHAPIRASNNTYPSILYYPSV